MALSGKDRQKAYMRRLRERGVTDALLTRIERLERLVPGPSVTNLVPNGFLKENPPDPLKKTPSLTSESQIRSLDDEFDEAYPLYPRHVGKGAARKAYRAARKKASFDEIIAGIRRCAIEHRTTEARFIPHPATWLNQERWLDEPKFNGNGYNGHVVSIIDPIRRAEIEDTKRRIRESMRSREDIESEL